MTSIALDAPKRAGFAALLARLLIGAAVLQFYTAGLGIFGAATFKAHSVIGLASVLASLALFVALVARRRGAEAWLAMGCLLCTMAQPVLVFVVRPIAQSVAAAHPVVGLAIGVLAWRILVRLRTAA